MRRAVRVFVHLAAGVSGVFFVIAVGIWIASYGSRYTLIVGSLRSNRTFSVSRGEASVDSVTLHGELARTMSSDDESRLEKDRPDDPGFDPETVAGFRFHRINAEDVTGFSLSFPIPVVAVLFALLPLIDVMLIRRRRRSERRLAAALCVRCGYDLRATPDRCPECATVPTTKAARTGGAGG